MNVGVSGGGGSLKVRDDRIVKEARKAAKIVFHNYYITDFLTYSDNPRRLEKRLSDLVSL